MNGVQRPLGYTIIEVMIVLAVSGLMFLIAANFISGKQQRTAFTAGVNEMASRMQDTIEQVSNGKYSDIPLSCFVNGSGKVKFNSSVQEQGTNSDCVFLGKVIHFRQAGSWPAAENSFHYEVFSIAGKRVNSGGNPVTKLEDADTTVIDDTHADLTTQQTVPQSLEIRKISALNSSGALMGEAYGIGFFQGLGTAPGGSLENGISPVKLSFVAGLVADMNNNDAKGKINDFSADAITLVTAPEDLPGFSLDMCLTDDSQYAHIILNTKENQLTVDVKWSGTTSCP